MIHIRDIAEMSVEEVIDEFFETYQQIPVVFDDGVLMHNDSEIIYTRFILNFYNKLPRDDFPISQRYSIASIGNLTPNTHLDLCGRIFFDYSMEYDGTEWDIDDRHMNRVLYKDVYNELYNFFVTYLQTYAIGANVIDIIDIIEHPPIKEANDKLKSLGRDPTPDELEEVYSVIEHETMNSPDFINNGFIIALRTKTIKMGQMQMVVGPIGYGTDINSRVFPHPNVNSFFEGSNELWQYAAESRNASIATLYNALIMPISQYANRRYQLFTGSVRYVVREDCGSTSYKKTYVKDKKHLNNLLGFWYLDERCNELKMITAKDTHLIGTVIQHRFITHCEWKGSRSEVCKICYGALYRAAVQHNNPYLTGLKGRNIGHISSAKFGGVVSGVVLGRKHHKASASASGFELTGVETEYIEVDATGKYILFRKSNNLKNLKVVLIREDVETLFDVEKGVKSRTHPSELTKVKVFLIRDEEFGTNSDLAVYVGSKQRTSYLSDYAIDYILKYGWEFDKDKNLIVNLNKWNHEWDFIVVPQVEISPPEFINRTVDFILGAAAETSNDKLAKKSLADYNNVGIDEAIDVLYSEIEGQLSIHYVHIATIVLATSAQDPKNNDYRLPYPRDSGTILSEKKLLVGISPGMQMAYEEQHNLLSSPRSYTDIKRRSHPLDALLVSKEYAYFDPLQPPLPGGNRRNSN